MKKLILFLAFVVALAAAPTTPINNANIQLNGVSQTGVLAGNTTGAATATQAQISAALDLLGSTRGSVLYKGASGWTILAPGTAGAALESGGAGADPFWGSGASGTVTSVGLSMPAIFTVSGSPVTTTGTLTATLANQAQNLVWAGPASGANAPPTFRSLVALDILPINLASSANGGVTGNLPVTNLNGGASASSSTFWRGDGTWANPISGLTTGSFILTGNGSGGLTNTDMTYSTPTQGVPDGYTISSAGSITLTAGGTNKSITITPSGSGSVSISTTPSNVAQTVISVIQATAGDGSTSPITSAGANFDVRHNQTSQGANKSDFIGVASAVRNINAGNVNSLVGFRTIGIVSSSGNVDVFMGYQARALITSSTGLVTTAYAFKADTQKTANVTTAYAFYNEGANDTNYFAGPMTLANVTATVPDAWTLTSAGSITLTASAASKNITLNRSSTGAVVVSSTLGGLPSGIDGSIDSLSVAGTMGLNAVGFSPTFYGRRMNGSFASPTAVTNGQVIFSLVAQGRKATAWSAYPSSPSIGMAASEDWTDSATGMEIGFAVTTNLTTSNAVRARIRNWGALELGFNGASTTAWGATGVILRTATSSTYVDTSSSGTVTLAVGSSFAVPTVNTSSVTTFTDMANVYIAGDIATTGNATGTNKYGLWNVGKTRLDGALLVNANITAAASGPRLILNNTAGATDTKIWDFRVSGTTFAIRAVNDADSTAANWVSVTRTSGTNTVTRADFIGIITTSDATDATIGGSGALVATGGIYAGKKIISGTSVFDGTTANLAITGGAGNMTITAGTGNSRTMALQTTTSGGTATTALSLNATQDATIAGDLTISGGDITFPSTGTITTGANLALVPLAASGKVMIGTGGGTSNIIEFQSSSARINTGNSSLVIARSSTNSSFELLDSAGSGAFRITGTTTPSMVLSNSGGGTTWFTFVGGNITGGAANTTITAGTGASRTLALQTTNGSSTAITALTLDASQNATFAGNITLGASTSSITGAAGNMTIIAGTGASRTLILQTTTSGSAATTALTLDASQNATFAGTITTLGGTFFHATSSALTDGAGVAAGTLTNAPTVGNPTKWIQINDNGTTRKIPTWQ